MNLRTAACFLIYPPVGGNLVSRGRAGSVAPNRFDLAPSGQFGMCSTKARLAEMEADEKEG